jgi:A/G-specific adenine glycosylase
MSEISLEWAQISERLIRWFLKEGRDLPWRRDKSPYRVWVSEIMLQQTRVEAVKPYFARFMEQLPEISDLAEIPQEALDKLWQGLGYYSRARNLKKCAQVLVEQYDGQMPADYDALLKLPGIGSYTAGAIASFAFGMPVAAVDGNVLRVMTRLSGSSRDIALQETKRFFEGEITAFLKTGVCEPGLFNGAIMELGAILCGPDSAPACERCPVQRFCRAYQQNQTDVLPVKSPKKPRRIEDWTVFIITDGQHFLIEQREKKGLLAGLYQFPSIPGVQEPEMLHIQNAACAKGPEAKHIFTHIEWRMTSWVVRTTAEELEKMHTGTRRIVTKQELLEQYAVPSAYRTYFKLVQEL